MKVTLALVRERHDSFDVSVISEKQHEVHELWSQSICQSFKKLLREFKIENLSKQFRFEVFINCGKLENLVCQMVKLKIGVKGEYDILCA